MGLEMLRAGSRVSPKVRDGKVSILIQVDAEAYIGDSNAFIDPIRDRELVPSIERRMATVIRNEIASALERAQKDYRSDIFGFGALIHRSIPGEWHRLKSQWDEEFFVIEVNVEVMAKIRRSGLVGRSTKIR